MVNFCSYVKIQYLDKFKPHFKKLVYIRKKIYMGTLDSVKEAGKITWKWIKICLLLLVLFLISYVLFIWFANYSEGTRTGYVTKISKRGYVFKTFEGELNTGFFTGAATANRPADNVWYFSVNNKGVADQIQKASETGHKVTLFYHQKYKKIFLRGDTDYLVYKIEESKDNPTPTPAVQ